MRQVRSRCERRTRQAGHDPGSTAIPDLRRRVPAGLQPPPQRALAEEFEVSRDTIQRALEELKTEGWIETGRGSGSKVRVTLPLHVTTQPRAPPGRVALGPFADRAFAQPVVELDVFTFTSESLDTHVRLQAEKIRNGQIPAPESITLRILLPSDVTELPYPRARATKEQAPDVAELDRILQARTREIIRRHTSSLRNALRNLKTEGLVTEVEVLVREVPLVPTHKLYLRRDAEGLGTPLRSG